LTELATDEMKGVFPGIIRRIAPWTDGQCVLGCQLLEKIPDELLDELALDGVINRRRDKRVDWTQPAKMSCELRSGEDEIEIRDCSHGGLKICSKSPIPEDVMLRITAEMDDETIVVQAKTVWQFQSTEGYHGGVAFTSRNVPGGVARILEEHSGKRNYDFLPIGMFKQPIAVAIAVIAATILLMIVRS